MTMLRFQTLAYLTLATVLFGAVGCAPPPKSSPEGASTTSTEPAASPDAGAAPKAEEPKAEEPKAEAPAAAAPATPEPKAETALASAGGAPATSEQVALGDPSLSAGIPGSGPLTLDQIKAWFDDPKNNAVLEVSLPMGLDKGAAQIKGLDKNPLTRAKIELGRQLYFDPRLSVDGTVSCASCHHPDEGWGRKTQFGVGVRGQTGGRNSPVSYNRILSDAQFWDGRADSLEAQAVGPIANPIEMANTHEKVVETLKANEGYSYEFNKVFGKLDIDAVGQAIAAFERSIVTHPSPYDYEEKLKAYEGADLEELKKDDPDLYAQYEKDTAAAQAHPMSESAKNGMKIFFSDKGNCSACHVGANLSDEKYHNLGIGMNAAEPDLGRYTVTKDEKDKGAFKTPTIRNVATSPPYMHDGSIATLAEVVEWYDKGGHANPYLSDKIKPLKLTEQEKKDLVAFMEACTGEFPKIATDRLPQ